MHNVRAISKHLQALSRRCQPLSQRDDRPAAAWVLDIVTHIYSCYLYPYMSSPCWRLAFTPKKSHCTVLTGNTPIQ